jgi:ADP-heptose:LPS heptosyltransferase
VVLSADKSRDACAFVSSLDCADVRGFTLSPLGQIVPADSRADYNFRMGLDDHLKFRVNERTGQDILAETWGLPYERDEYVLHLSAEEEDFCARQRAAWDLEGRVVVGFNTGCSELFPNKKMTVEQHVRLAHTLLEDPSLVVLLLGGPEDSARNAEIEAQVRAAAPAGRLIDTPSTEGLRRGICYENLADAVVTGDSFGMHMAIALRKHVFAWFGLSCWQEIDLYGRGALFPPDGLDCAPCWKRVCPYNLECIQMIDLDAIARHVRAFVHSRSTA